MQCIFGTQTKSLLRLVFTQPLSRKMGVRKQMRKLLLYLVLILLSISLATAVEINTDKTDYSGNEMVSITISQCTGTSILKIINPGFDLVDIKADQDNWVTLYNTLSDSADGKYTLTVSCTNGDAQANFCVDSPGCIPETPPAPPSGGAGRRCIPEWSCSQWSYCDANLQQTRSCTDLKNCQPPREETRECDQCQESWVCSLWSECQFGTNSRTCADEHFCGTNLLKPATQKSCQIATPPGPPPRQISPQIPIPSYTAPPPLPTIQEPGFSLAQFWEQFKVHVIAGVSGLVLLILIIFLVLHFVKGKKTAFNVDELREWVKKER